MLRFAVDIDLECSLCLIARRTAAQVNRVHFEDVLIASHLEDAFLHSLGWVHFKLGHLDEAERCLSESVRLDGEAALAHEHLGDVHARRGETRQARDAWKKALTRSVEAQSRARLKEKLNSVKE